MTPTEGATPAEYCLVLTTVETGQPADDMATALVEQRLAGCVQRTTAHSVFRWNERVEHSREELLLVKTTRERLAAVIRWLEDNHPYDVPEITVLPIADGSAAYLTWLSESVS